MAINDVLFLFLLLHLTKNPTRWKILVMEAPIIFLSFLIIAFATFVPFLSI
jgi:hypothetical protein